MYLLGQQACQSQIDLNQEVSGPKKDNDDEEYHLHQMTTVLDDNVHNFGVDGSSDDLDVPIKVVHDDNDNDKDKDKDYDIDDND